MKYAVTLTLILLFLGLAIHAAEQSEADTSGLTLSSDTSETDIESKLAVAVIQLDANGISTAEARALTDRLRLEIFNYGVYEVMERDKMTRILDEMQFQLSGCTSNDCAIEVGRLVGVKKMIAGSVSKVAELYTVSIRMIDVTEGRIEATAVEDIEGSLGDVLTRAIPAVAAQISGLDKPVITPQNQNPSLLITTDPAEAEVYLDGLYQGLSPLELELLPDKDHLIKIKKDRYIDWEKRFQLTKDQSKEVSIALSLKPAELKTEAPPENLPQPTRKPAKPYQNCFRIRYARTSLDEELSNHITDLNHAIGQGRQMYKHTIEQGVSFSEVQAFNGIEFYNTYQASPSVGYNFSISVYMAELEDRISALFQEQETAEYNLIVWSPQLTLSLRIAPIRYPLFFPFFNIGYSYNLLLMNAYKNNKSLGTPTYQSWGLTYGFGFQIKPLKVIGISLDWNQRMMDMELMDLNQITDNFKTNDMREIDLSSSNVGLSLDLYF